MHHSPLISRKSEWYRRNQPPSAIHIYDLMGRSKVGVEVPVPAGIAMESIQDQPFEEAIDHAHPLMFVRQCV
jgi:hypothetical protein